MSVEVSFSCRTIIPWTHGAEMYGSVEVPLVGMKPEERKPLVNVSGSGRNAPDFLEDLDPSDKDFWRDVRVFLDLRYIIR